MLGLEAWPRPRGLSRLKFCGLGVGLEGPGFGLGLEGSGLGLGLEGPGLVNIPATRIFEYYKLKKANYI